MECRRVRIVGEPAGREYGGGTRPYPRVKNNRSHYAMKRVEPSSSRLDRERR